MEPTSKFVRESEGRDAERQRPALALTGWEMIVFEVRDDPQGAGSADPAGTDEGADPQIRRPGFPSCV